MVQTQDTGLPPELAWQLNGNGPYPSVLWTLGGPPEVGTDVPITAVLLPLYIAGAIGHLTLYLRNKRNGQGFIFSSMLFGFCMSRIVTCCVRLAWITNASNIDLAIASQVFTSAGVLLVYVINLAFTQRILRARHPSIGWHRTITVVLITLYALIAVSLIMVITATIQSYFTLSADIHRIDRNIQLSASSYLFFVAFLPIPILSVILLLPRRPVDAALPYDKFGVGRFRHQVAIVLAATATICFGAAFRLSTGALDPVPRTQPMPDYFSRVCFYVFNFVLEILVIYFYLFVRVDRRFYVPDGEPGPGSYSLNAKRAALEKGRSEEEGRSEEGDAEA